MALFEIENLSYWYPESATPALKNIILQIEEGELLLIAGGSGSGKSTLGRLLAGLIPDFYGGKLAGKAHFRGKRLPELERRFLNTQVGMVFQDPEQQLVMTTVEAEIAFGLENLGLPQEEISRRLAEVMGFLGLTPLKQEFTANLSGGQKQKVALASVLAMNPGVLILEKDTRTAALPEMAGRVGYLAQNPNSCLFQETVEAELRFTLDNLSLEDGGAIDEVLARLGLVQYRQSNPRDLSSGERQRVALAAILVASPSLLLLDEPTRGLDMRLKKELGSCLSGLAREGLTILMVTHDMEFAAEFAERAILMHDGRIVSDGSRHEVLGNSPFYSPQMARLFRGTAEGVLTVEEGLEKIAESGELIPCLARRAGV